MANKVRCGILYSEIAQNGIPLDSLRRAAVAVGTEPALISAESVKGLKPLSLLINNLGEFYPEEGLAALFDFYSAGGTLVSAGAKALTRPYRMAHGKPESLPPTDAALHSFGLVDTHVNTGPVIGKTHIETTPRYRFLDALHAAGRFPRIRECYSMDVRMATRPSRPEDLYASHGVVEARFEAGCVLREASGRRMWCPVSQIDHFRKGSLVFLNFAPKDPDYFASEDGLEFLMGILQAALRPRWNVSVQPSYSRYYPDDPVRLEWRAARLGRVGARKGGRNSFSVETTLFRADMVDRTGGNPLEELCRKRPVPLQESTETHPLRLGRLEEGRYSVRVLLRDRQGDLVEAWTGFYVASEESIRRILKGLQPMEVRPEIAADYAVCDGKPVPMHGTTYVVTDLYRDCFQRVNVHLCDREMGSLRKAGMNVLRTGVWTGYAETFKPFGPFRETSIRSLDAYFLTAARHGLYVQFAFAAFVMNHWDRERNPCHDPVMIRRIERMFRQFAKRFRGWPNVQVDIINEPSYSPYRHGWMWNIARPFHDRTEHRAFVAWLRRRYGALTRLREAWGVAAPDFRNFEAVRPPALDEFHSHYDGTTAYDVRPLVTDFCRFARDSFTQWTRRIREIIKAEDPHMLVMIGRDETLRVPSQQDEFFKGNIDLLNWHQWHREGAMFMEYVLNRVRGVPCCGQEMGALAYKDQRNSERLQETDCRNLLERKLLYCLGNFIQWQAYSDISMDFVCEGKLGLIRADGTERPSMNTLRLLAWLEDRMAPFLTGRKEEEEDILLVNPTSLWFSSDHRLAYRAMKSAVYALQFHLGRKCEMALEHLLREKYESRLGNPALIIVAAPTILERETWDYLIRLMKRGKTVAVSGALGLDPYWRAVDYLSELGLSNRLENVATVERLRIGKKEFPITFHEAFQLSLPGKGLSKAVLDPKRTPQVRVVQVGRGKFVYAPVPIEMGDSLEPVKEFYEKALAESRVHEKPFSIPRAQPCPAHFVYPIHYARCTAYTVINEGPGATVRFRDTRTGADCRVQIDKERGAKLYLDRKGNLQGAFLSAPLRVNDLRIEPHGALALFRSKKGWVLFPGERRKGFLRIGAARVSMGREKLFTEISVI